jgi:hypothetical protein
MVLFQRGLEQKVHVERDLPNIEHLSTIIDIYYGEYDESGWIEGVPEPDDLGEPCHYYSEYNGQKFENTVRRHNYPAVFFTEEAWKWGVLQGANAYFYGEEWIQETLKKNEETVRKIKEADGFALFEYTILDNIDIELVEEYMKVHRACDQLRRNIFAGERFKGSQGMDLDPYVSLQSVMEEMLKTRVEERADW